MIPYRAHPALFLLILYAFYPGFVKQNPIQEGIALDKPRPVRYNGAKRE